MFPSVPEHRVPEVPPSGPLIAAVNGRIRASAELREDGKLEEAKQAHDESNAFARELYLQAASTSLKFSANSQYGIFERLVYFWRNHFAVTTLNQASYTGIVLGYEAECIRPHVDGYFATMLRAAVTHPLLMRSLGQASSFGPNSPIALLTGRGINENLGREVLELHTLGSNGGYTQQDVEEMAALLSGFRVRWSNGTTQFNWGAVEPGSETILGKSYGGLFPSRSAVYEALDDLAVHPSTARHISLKLARHFISDDPPESIVDAISAEYRRTDGYLPAVYEMLFEVAESTEPFAKFKSPLDFVLSGLRALGSPDRAFTNISAPSNLNRGMSMSAMRTPNQNDGDSGIEGLPDLSVGALSVMGHRLLSANGPNGWSDNAVYWLHADGIAKRLDWASQVALFSNGTGEQFIDGALGDLVSDSTRRIVAEAKSGTQGVALALMSPEFNRR